MATSLPIDGNRIERTPDVCKRLGVSKATLGRMVAEGRFPKPVRLTRQLNGWRASDVAAWFDAQFGKAGVQ